jgi:hypothetical protein
MAEYYYCTVQIYELRIYGNLLYGYSMTWVVGKEGKGRELGILPSAICHPISSAHRICQKEMLMLMLMLMANAHTANDANGILSFSCILLAVPLLIYFILLCFARLCFALIRVLQESELDGLLFAAASAASSASSARPYCVLLQLKSVNCDLLLLAAAAAPTPQPFPPPLLALFCTTTSTTIRPNIIPTIPL